MPYKPPPKNLAYGMGSPLLSLAPIPIIAQRAPLATDRAEIGQPWINQVLNDTYILTSIVSGASNWEPTGGGTGAFDTVTATTTIAAGTTLAAGTSLDVGTSAVIGTTLTVSGLGLGVVQSSGVGLLSSANGTDGQLLIGSTAAPAVFGAITSATLVITPGAGTLNIEESGGTANSYVTDIAGPVVPLVGVLDVLGGTNVTTGRYSGKYNNHRFR